MRFGPRVIGSLAAGILLVAGSAACDGRDEAGAKGGSTTSPALVGKGVKAARGALPAGASVTVKDVSGGDRVVIVEGNRKVCTQESAAGAAYTGQPVRLGAAKTEEKCG